MVKYAYIAESSNGRTHPSGGCYLGSNPSSAALRLLLVAQGLRPIEIMSKVVSAVEPRCISSILFGVLIIHFIVAKQIIW